MPTYTASKSWNAAETLTAADLNGIESGVATFLNTTKLDGDNISATAEYTFGGIVLGSGGPASPDGGNLHSFNGDASASAHADADEGVFENSAAAGISILSGASSAGNIFFGDSGDNDIGKVSYDHTANALTFTTNATLALTLSSAQLATFAGAIQANSTVTVGVNDTGYDVQFFGATAAKSMLWDESADTLIIAGKQTISETLLVTGITTHGGNVVSDTDSTDDLGTSSVRWANLFVDSIGDTGQDLTIAATTTNLPSGHVTDYAGADVVLTHSAGVLNVSTGALQVGGVAVGTGDALLGSTGTWTADQTFNDSVKVTLGTGGDVDFYFDGTNTILLPRVVGTGNVGINTTTPLEMLDVTGDTSADQARIVINDAYNGSATEAGIDFYRTYDTGGANQLAGYIRHTRGGGDVNGGMVFGYGTRGSISDRMTIDSSGRVGIGSSPDTDALLSVFATSLAYAGSFKSDGGDQSNGGLRVWAGQDDGGGNTKYLDCYDGDGGSVGYIWNTSGTFALVDVSDERTKTDIVATGVDGLAVIKAIEVKDFTRAKSGERVLAGFTAQQMLTAYPKAVACPDPVEEELYTEDDVLPEGAKIGDVKIEAVPDPIMGVAKDALIGPLVRATQQLLARVEALEAV